MVEHHQQKQDYKQGITVIVRSEDLEYELKLAGSFKMKAQFLLANISTVEQF